MNPENVHINRQTFRRLLHAVRMFLTSPVRGKAWLLLGSLIFLMLCINGMNVANSFVGRYFMSAIERIDNVVSGDLLLRFRNRETQRVCRTCGKLPGSFQIRQPATLKRLSMDRREPRADTFHLTCPWPPLDRKQ